VNQYQDLVDKLLSVGVATTQTLAGCSELEIAQVQSSISGPMPRAYLEFLDVMGNGAGWLFQGSDIYFPDVLNCKNTAKEVIQTSDSGYKLAPTAFVFYSHQGYQFIFFDTKDGDDPPVYRFQQSSYQPELVDAQFSNWLSRCVDESCLSWPNYKEFLVKEGLVDI